MQEERRLGLHPRSPLPPPELGLVLFDVPAQGGGGGTDRSSGPATLDSQHPRPGREAAGLSGGAPGDQYGGRSCLRPQRSQVSQRNPTGVEIGCSLEFHPGGPISWDRSSWKEKERGSS